MITLKNKNNISESELIEIISLEQEIFFHNGYTLENLNSFLESQNFYCLVYKDNSQILGYSLFFLNEQEAEIYKIAVVYNYRNKKIGSKLISYLKENYKSIFLEVSDRDNTINFYLKNNFKVIHKRDNYYSDNSNAFLMKWIKKDI